MNHLYGISVAAAIGFLIGLEREKSQKESDKSSVAGIRTFTLIALVGVVCALLVDFGTSFFAALVGGGLIILFSLGYFFSSSRTKDIGLTTEVTQLLVFALGFLSHHQGLRELSVILAVTTSIVLAFKEKLHEFTQAIKEHELRDTLKFAVIAFIILPILPNETVDPWNVVNPYELWLLVVLISGISYVGYVLIKIFGVGKGMGLTGLLGGLSSSTAVTTSMATRSKEQSGLNYPAAFAAIIASNVMVPRIAFEVFIVNPDLLPKVLLPLAFMLAGGLVSSFFIWRKAGKEEAQVKLDSPFAIKPALKFGAFFLVVLLLQYFAKQTLGTAGLYGVSVVSGLADVDAITLSTARMAVQGGITSGVAVNAIILAAISNTLMKFVYAYLWGGKGFAKLVGIATFAMVAAAAASLFFI